MTESKSPLSERVLDPLDPNDEPPQDRFCDVVLDGGVINGVVYPGFLIELARKFRFRSLGGTSVGAIAAALAAACEYNRRYQGNNGFNEGLAKMPTELASLVDEENQITKIRSLFQPEPKVERLFNWFVDLLGTRLQRIDAQVINREKREVKAEAEAFESTPETSHFMRLLLLAWVKAVDHFGPNSWWLFWWMLAALDGVLLISKDYALTYPWQIMLWQFFYLLGVILIHPVCIAIVQVCRLIKSPGFGACTGMRASPSNAEGLFEWLYEGVQKAANLPIHKPLTFADLWQAPCGPKAADGSQEPRSIDLRMITTCLSYGRIYELPLEDDTAFVMFKLSELKPYFSDAVMAHLRRVSKPVIVESCSFLQSKLQKRSVVIGQMEDPNLSKDASDKLHKKVADLTIEFKACEDGFGEPDIRELPRADLPIVVAARMSMAVPILFQSIPLIGFNLDENFEDTKLVRLWFSDGGIGSNFPIHLFDKPIPRWPTFGLKILDESPRKTSTNSSLKAYIPFGHLDGMDDNLLYSKDNSGFTNIDEKKSSIRSFIKMVFSIYTSAKDGHDQSFLRMPDVRNRIVRIYMDHRAGNMLNLKIEPDKIIQLARDVGALGGRLAAQAYLAQVPQTRHAWVNAWQDHRWVRFSMLTEGLRSYLKGFTHAVHLNALPGSENSNTLIDQVKQSTQNPPLASRSNPSDEVLLTQNQSSQFLAIINAISVLETQLLALDSPQPYTPEPMPVLRFKPRY